MRYIDWKKGNPYIWTMADKDLLMNTPFLWARKFDLSIDAEIIEYLKINIISSR